MRAVRRDLRGCRELALVGNPERQPRAARWAQIERPNVTVEGVEGALDLFLG